MRQKFQIFELKKDNGEHRLLKKALLNLNIILLWSFSLSHKQECILITFHFDDYFSILLMLALNNHKLCRQRASTCKTTAFTRKT
jgi:hypothetical protein